MEQHFAAGIKQFHTDAPEFFLQIILYGNLFMRAFAVAEYPGALEFFGEIG